MKNLLVVTALLEAVTGVALKLSAIGLWPAVGWHGALALWSVVCLTRPAGTPRL